MCKTFSGFSTEQTLVHWAPEASDSHETLADLLGITKEPAYRVQWEFYPPKGEWDKPELYQLHTDQDIVPDWWDQEYQEKVVEELRTRLQRMIRTDKCKVLAGGPWILGDSFKAGETANCQIVAVGRGCKVSLGEIKGNVVIHNIAGSVTTKIVCVGGSVVTRNMSGSVTTGYVEGSVITGNVEGSVTTGDVYVTGFVTTGNVYKGGSVTIKNVEGSVITGYVGGSVTTGDVYKGGSMTTGYVCRGGSVTTRDMEGSVTIGDVYMRGSVTTGYVCRGGSVTTGYVEGSVATGYVAGLVAFAGVPQQKTGVAGWEAKK